MRKLLALLCLLALLPSLAQAAMKVAIVSATAANGTPTYTQDFTDSATFAGATPKCAIILGSAATAEDASTANIQSTIGFVAGAQASIGISDNDAVSTNSSSYANYATQAYSLPDFSGNTVGDATGAMIANGVRLSWTDQSQGELVKVVLLGGDVECAVSSLTSNNGTSAQAVTHGLTAAPQAIVAMSPGQVAGDNSGNAKYGIGFWDGTNSKSLGVSLNQAGQTTTTATGQLSSTVLLANKANASGFTWTAAISNVGATTFDITLSANSTNLMHFLSIRSTSGTALGVKAGTFATKTSTGTNADITGMSQSPQVVLYALSRTIAVDTNYSGVDDASVLGLGIAAKNTGTGTTQYATIINCSVDAAATSGNHAYTQTSNTGAIRILDASTACSADVEATINSWDSGGITNNYSNIAATGRQVLYLAIGGEVAAPTWSVSPTVSAQDTDSYTLSYTPSTSCTFKVVVCKKDTAAPDAGEVVAGTCDAGASALATASEDVTGADTTETGTLSAPIGDIYATCNNAGGNAPLATLADEMLDAPTGYGPNSLASSYTLLASVSGTSWIADLNATITPDVAAADVVKITTTTWPSAYAWTQSTDGNGSYTDPNGSRQYLTFDIYDTSAGDWMSGGPATLWFNNSVPVASNDGQYNSDADPLIDGVAMTTVDLKGFFDDADGDTLTCTSSDTGTGTGANKRPAGTTITDGSWAGTPTSTGTTSGSFTITCTDTPGDSDTLDVTWAVYDQVSVPDCDGNTAVDCALELAAVELSAAATYACSDLVASGDVVSQLPAASTLVNPFTVVDIVVSTGSCTGIDLLPTIYTATAVPSTAVYRGGAAFAQTGERYVTYFDADDVFYIGAIPYRNDGAMMICVDCAVVTRVRGIGLASTTAVVTATTCNPSTVVAGIPLNSDGAVCMTDIN